jgi:hypothetical protein
MLAHPVASKDRAAATQPVSERSGDELDRGVERIRQAPRVGPYRAARSHRSLHRHHVTRRATGETEPDRSGSKNTQR